MLSAGQDPPSARSSGSRHGVPYLPLPDRIGTAPEDEAETPVGNLSTRISALASVPEFSLQGEVVRKAPPLERDHGSCLLCVCEVDKGSSVSPGSAITGANWTGGA